MSKKDYVLKNKTSDAVPPSMTQFAVEVDEGKVKRLSRPPMISPKVLGHGTVGGVIISSEQGVGKFKQSILHLRHKTAGEFSFPVTKVVKSALAQLQSTSEESIEWEKLNGVEIAIKGLGKSKTSDGKRSVNRMEIFVLNSPKK